MPKASVVMEWAGLRGRQTIYKKIVDEMSGGECMLSVFRPYNRFVDSDCDCCENVLE